MVKGSNIYNMHITIMKSFGKNMKNSVIIRVQCAGAMQSEIHYANVYN